MTRIRNTFLRKSDFSVLRSIRRKLKIPPRFEINSPTGLVCGLEQTWEFGTNHQLSRAPSVRWSSYSTVSKYSPVLQNCKVWASSDHWSWRYMTWDFAWIQNIFWCYFHHILLAWADDRSCLGNQTNTKSQVMYLHDQWSDEADTLWFCSTDEYSKITKYEPQTPLASRVMLWFHHFQHYVCHTNVMPIGQSTNIFLEIWSSRAILSELISKLKHRIDLNSFLE